MKEARHKRLHTVGFTWHSGKGKTTATESRAVVVRSHGWEKEIGSKEMLKNKA